jgi:hypothetical protein
MKTRTYDDLAKIDNFQGRYEYLKLSGLVGQETFGFDRFINQKFYKSQEWREVREAVIFRDRGMDLGVLGREIVGPIVIHHMNPITVSNLINFDPNVLVPKFLISVSLRTHNAIHYSNKYLIADLKPERKKNDTKLW